ncbi:hypothetical protein OEZ86_010928 [Tetradesmus obliquus]|nr:hypothetical protein OEZ86_010928 [Tetradesmus obliquus]
MDLQQTPPSPRGAFAPSPAASPPPGRPAHLQPLDGQPYRNGSAPPTPPGKSSQWPAGSARAATAGASLQKSNSDLSVASMHSLQQQLQQQQQQQQQSDADNIKVVVRLRPLFPHEQSKGAAEVAHVSEDYSSLKVVVPGPAGATMQKEFSFHACLGPETSQADVMALCGIQQLLDAALAGYHVTIFAYGQTGSGKTHTMSGKEDIISDDAYNGHEHDGIISRAVHYLFQQVHTRKDAKYSLKASYLEIYNEGVYDLVHFNPKAKSLPVKWDASYGFYVQGLKVVPCSQQRTMMEVIRTGMKHRKVGSHRLNMESSRSHAIMTIYCDATPTDPNSYDFGTIRYGKLSFVDLAGSERVKDSMSEGTMLKETININKSLSALGKVISTLAEHDAAGTTAHVPYRDSKLTKLLMDSLGGSALTLMIACCSPSSLQVEETLSTLSYATRAKNIHNRPTVQYDPREAQISLLRREIELLRQENGLLREQLRAGGAASGSAHNSLPTTPKAAQLAGRPSVLGIPQQMGSPGSSVASSPIAGLAAPGALSSSPVPHAADEQAAAAGMPRANSTGGLAPHSASTEQQLRASLNELDLRSNAARHAAGVSSSGSPINNSELLRRLRETQALLVKFSEENGRLARDNEKLQAGRNVLSAEHATVLDEIDLLRGKLSQLERNVLTAAAMATTTNGSQPQAQQQQQAPGSAAAQGAAGGVAGGGMINIQALLASLGLGGDVAADLPAVGIGPQGAEMGGPGQDWSGTADAEFSLRPSMQMPSGSSSSSPAAAAAEISPGRSVLVSPGGSSRLGMKSRSNLSSASSPGPSSIATAAKSIINRTPLRPSNADTGVDDSIIVSNAPGLALLLGPGSGSINAAAPVEAGLAPGQLGPPGSSSSSSAAAGGASIHVQQQAHGVPAPLRVPGYAGAAGAAPPSPKAVSFGASQQLEVYSQLPSSATSTSSAINRPLPFKPQDKAAGFLARKDGQQQQQQQRLAAARSPPPRG